MWLMEPTVGQQSNNNVRSYATTRVQRQTVSASNHVLRHELIHHAQTDETDICHKLAILKINRTKKIYRI